MERTSRGHIVNYNPAVAQSLIESAHPQPADHGACKRAIEEAGVLVLYHYERAQRFAKRADHHKRRACQWKSLAIALLAVLVLVLICR